MNGLCVKMTPMTPSLRDVVGVDFQLGAMGWADLSPSPSSGLLFCQNLGQG